MSNLAVNYRLTLYHIEASLHAMSFAIACGRAQSFPWDKYTEPIFSSNRIALVSGTINTARAKRIFNA